ncbi:MAG: Fur family transcriptional regulator [Burkholderiales bacterium]
MASNDLIARLRDSGWPMTSQRRVVAEVLSGDHVHLSADEVHRLALLRLPEISRATVYKALGELVALGEVREVSVGGRAKLYDPNHDATHQHLVCDECGVTRDVQAPSGGALRPAKSDLGGFTLTGVEIVFRGLCPKCAKSQSATTGRTRRNTA